MVRLIIRPVGNNCNLKCKYCVTRREEDKMMTQDTLVKGMKKILSMFKKNHAKHLSVVFHGGEPLLAGTDFFKTFEKEIRKYEPQFNTISRGVQTNATLLNSDFVSLFKKYNYIVSVSLDGPKESNTLRVWHNKESVFDTVLQKIDLLREKNVKYNILVTIGTHNYKNINKIVSFFNKRHENFGINFLINSDYDLTLYQKCIFMMNFLKYKNKNDWSKETLKIKRCRYYNRCLRDFASFALDFDGKVYLCNKFADNKDSFDGVLFDIYSKQDMLSQIYHSKLYLDSRNIISTQDCKNCEVPSAVCGKRLFI